MAISPEQIRATLERFPNATDQEIVDAMMRYGVTPQQVQNATGRNLRVPFGQSGGYSDEQVRGAVMDRARSQDGFLSAAELQKAATNYGISPEQLMRAFPEMQQGMQGVAYSTGLTGVAPALSTLNRTEQNVRDAFSQGQQYMTPYTESGAKAQELQAALSGALGREAQQAAFDEYMSSPALDFLQRESERALTRNAAALGGLGGGNVRKDLMDLTAGLYSQDFANNYARLGELATRGYGGAGQMLSSQQNLASQLGGLGRTGAGYQFQGGRDLSQNVLNTATNLANAQMGAAEGMGGAYGQAGVNTGNIYSTLGGQQATSAEQLSRDLAANVMSQGAYASGVPGQTYTPVNAYNPASPLIAGGMAYDWARGVFGHPSNYQNQLLTGNVPFGTGGNGQPVNNPSQPTYMMPRAQNLYPGFNAQNLLPDIGTL